MTYTINRLAKLASISVRTLHYYDQIGLLKPSRLRHNGYREYGETELLKLQQILFFRELDFTLADIKRIMSSQNFSLQTALIDQRNLIELRKKRLCDLITTINKTLKKITNKHTMNDQELYAAFSDEEQKKYAAEVKARWGHTDIYRQSQERLKKLNPAELEKIKLSTNLLMNKIAATMGKGATSPEFQGLIDQHYNSIKIWYEPNLELYRNLADMYVNDQRFIAYYEKFAPGLAEIMREAIIFYCAKKN